MKELSSSDLRVGNIVTDEFYDSFKTFIKVDSIDKNGINLTIQDDGGYTECCQHWLESEIPFDKLFGIPLTQEILVNICGFEKRDIKHNQRYINDDFEIELQGSFVAYVLWSEDAPHLTQFIGHCQYLHELQNLHKVIKKKELEIKL